MKLPVWANNVLTHALSHPDEPYAAYCRWEGKHPETLRKFRKANPEFEVELQRRRAGIGELETDAVGIEQFCNDPDYLGLD